MPRDEEEALLAAVGARIKALRVAGKRTQLQVAEQLGREVGNYQRLESGCNMTLRTLSRVAAALGVSAREILP